MEEDVRAAADALQPEGGDGRSHQQGGAGKGKDVGKEEMGREGVEPQPGQGTGKDLAGNGQGGCLPDSPERVEPKPFRIPAFQVWIEEEDASHG